MTVVNQNPIAHLHLPAGTAVTPELVEAVESLVEVALQNLQAAVAVEDLLTAEKAGAGHLMVAAEVVGANRVVAEKVAAILAEARAEVEAETAARAVATAATATVKEKETKP